MQIAKKSLTSQTSTKSFNATTQITGGSTLKSPTKTLIRQPSASFACLDICSMYLITKKDRYHNVFVKDPVTGELEGAFLRSGHVQEKMGPGDRYYKSQYVGATAKSYNYVGPAWITMCHKDRDRTLQVPNVEGDLVLNKPCNSAPDYSVPLGNIDQSAGEELEAFIAQYAEKHKKFTLVGPNCMWQQMSQFNHMHRWNLLDVPKFDALKPVQEYLFAGYTITSNQFGDAVQKSGLTFKTRPKTADGSKPPGLFYCLDKNGKQTLIE